MFTVVSSEMESTDQIGNEQHCVYSWSDWVLVYVDCEVQRITSEQRPLYSKYVSTYVVSGVVLVVWSSLT